MILRFRIGWPDGDDVAELDLPWLDVGPSEIARAKTFLSEVYDTEDVAQVE